MRHVYVFFLFFITAFYSLAQEIAIGEWNVHIPYRNAIAVAESDTKIYCASESSLFTYDLNDNSVTTFTKASGLSDAGISTIAYSKEYETLIIAYSNGNIDLVENNKIINLSDIKRKSITGTKTINHIMFMGNEAWMACSFGIVILDITSKNFLGNWYIGPNGTNVEVKDLTFDEQYIYASTADGIYRADINSINIQDYNYWSKMSGLPSGNYNCICSFANKIYTNYSTTKSNADTLYEFNGSEWNYAKLENIDETNTDKRPSIRVCNNQLVVSFNYYVRVYNDSGVSILTSGNYGTGKDTRDGLYDKNGYIWLADNGYGLIRSSPWGGILTMAPSGPSSMNVFDIASSGAEIWVAPGGLSPTYSNIYNIDGVSNYKDGEWTYYAGEQIPELDTCFDIITTAINPSNTADVFFGSSLRGVLELNNNQLVNVFSYYNSPLSYPSGQDCQSYCRVDISDLEFDNESNLWVLNPTVTKPLVVKLSTGDWKSFSCDNLISTSKRPTHVITDPYNQKWVTIDAGGILVFDEKNTYDDESDDLAKVLNTSAGNGGLHTNSVTCVALDLDSAIWIGTNEGPCIITSPEYVFTGDNFDASRPIVSYGDYAEYLLQNEYITVIAVDGANRKWIGTQTSGVYLVSSDGLTQIEHFDDSNSPLLSNNIRSIAINSITGEVFFGTDKGIVSYKGTATAGTSTYDEMFIYPNPVRESFAGSVAIRGLVANSDVKITDISGNIVYQTIAEGGQATWNRMNFKGEVVRSGIYLVFCTSPDGTQNKVGKIAFVH